MTGWDNDEIYKITDNMKCAKKKMNTLYNALKLRLRISVGTIIIKGMNEEVIDKIKDSMNTLDYKAGTSFEFRNVGQVGRYMIGKDENYSFDELKKLITSKFNQGAILENNQYSFSYKYNKYRINITNWEGVDGGFDDNTNSVRGRLTPDFKISPFLEHIKENEGGY
tara:strand:+ start:37 stop:537 length:501 start_codon:yes stop_codon:yes gene_type:complete